MEQKGTGGFIQPEAVLSQLIIEPGMKVADFGCGAGYFSILLAKKVGVDGRVYVIDILKTALESVESRAKLEGLENIEYIWSNLELQNGSKLKEDLIDMALLANILFQSQKKSDIIREAKRVLKRKGKMILIDWSPQERILGPREGWRMDKKEAQKLAEDEGLKFIKEFDAGSHHFGLEFEKS